MMRLCPSCNTERSLSELVCEGTVDGRPCNWDLAGLPLRPAGWRPLPDPEAEVEGAAVHRTCINGHAVRADDLICPTCQVDLEDALPTQDLNPDEPVDADTVGDWRLERRLPSTSRVRERFIAVRARDDRRALLTLYAEGHEPDPEIYDALKTLSRDHVPEILESGRWNDRPYEVTEDLQGGTLADLGLLPDDIPTLSRVLSEVGGALHSFAECGLRHRDLRPGAILVRTREPLDLVVTSFGSARLSDFDLDIVSPLETTRYTAPEALAGGVAAASDWWSLGMVLLEQVTHGECFRGVEDQAFLIHVVTKGAPIPAGLPASVDLLLRGLLARDRRERWGWSEVHRWLTGDMPSAPASAGPANERVSPNAIQLVGRSYTSATAFALAAADAGNWDAAKDLLQKGNLGTWLLEAQLDVQIQSDVGYLNQLEGLSEDIRLSLALKVLNPAMPLVCRGEIITPGWLLDNPEEAYRLIAGPGPDFLEKRQTEIWLVRLKQREAKIRDRARLLNVTLVEEELQVHLLSTSRARLTSLWADKRRVLPDTDHPGLISLIERRQGSDEDFILLLSADVGQFRAADAILAEAADLASKAGVESYSADDAREWLERPRREVFSEIDRRTEGFARCELERVDEWADQFRLERRLPIAKAISLLGVREERWKAPPKQTYVATLLDFFAKRVTAAVMRGPLTRMTVTKTGARLDLTQLGTSRSPASRMLEHLLFRSDQYVNLDPEIFTLDTSLEQRVRKLHSHATLYKRDTGIDGLYLGFPFLMLQEARASIRPRIAPVMLWPIKIRPEVGARGKVSIAFDRDREEVRVNPALETILGPEATRRWKEAANELLGRATLSAADVVDAFSNLVSNVQSRELSPLPNKEVSVKIGASRLVCSATLFHLAYRGQAVMEDLKQLRSIPPTGTSLETALKVGEQAPRATLEHPREIDRYFTAPSDPSQETAVMEARSGSGLVVQGPPGTGKSQTIVNLVSDSIGRKKSLLIVCQKQTALEVVHKRLLAEGLGDRIVMVNDVNKDREGIISAVRAQLEHIFARPAGALAWRAQRQQVAARIETLEGDLNSYHTALYTADEELGLSYRQVLADIMDFESGDIATPDVPTLRSLLSGLNSSEVVTLQETCGPLARYWLPSAFEEGSLHGVRSFSADNATVSAFRVALKHFVDSEKLRRDNLAATPNALQVGNPVQYRDWLLKASHPLQIASEASLERIQRWLEILQGTPNSAADRILVDLQSVIDTLAENSERSTDPAITAHLLRLNDVELAALKSLAESVSAPASFADVILLRRWTRGRRLNKEMTKRRLLDKEAFLLALRTEVRLRAPRRRIGAVLNTLKEPAIDLGPLGAQDLLLIAKNISSYLTEAQGVFAHLSAFPDPEAAIRAARNISRSSLQALTEAVEQGCLRCDAREASLSALDGLRHYMADRWLSARSSTISTDGSNGAALSALIKSLPAVPAFQIFRARASNLSELSLSVFRALREVGDILSTIPEGALDGIVRRIIGRESRLAWRTSLESKRPSLLFQSAELDAKIAALEVADAEMRSLNRRLLVDGVDASVLQPHRKWEDITRLRGQRAIRLREFLEKGSDLGLMALRPIWLMNPDVASRLLPLRRRLFDAVIYDEASQIPIEFALPTLYRSGSMIVSGDEKQMPPTTFFSNKVENDEADNFESEDDDEFESEAEREAQLETWNRREIKDCPDLLQLAKAVLPSTTLDIHYRSAYRELIQFSNAAFYGNRLSVPARHPRSEILRALPVQLIQINGTYADQTNQAEANYVAKFLSEYWKSTTGPRKTIGVVTFNRRQADLIDKVLEDQAEADPAFRQALVQEGERMERGEDQSFFVKNVENVQGDERDVIIFSSAFGRNSQGAFRRFFGVLGQEGGERRLNVAITRAREKVVLITSMPIGEISDYLTTRRSPNVPRDYIQAYFEYARAVSAGEMDVVTSLLARLTSNQPRSTTGPPDETDGFKTSVGDYIRSLGWEPHAIPDAGAFGLDFAIEDPTTGLFGLGIECDSPRHPLLESARARELWRRSILTKSVRRLHRISSRSWLEDRELEQTRLRNAIVSALEEGQVA